MRWPHWLHHPLSGVREAKKHLASSEVNRAEMREITEDIRQLREENHITARVHAAMRGGRA